MAEIVQMPALWSAEVEVRIAKRDLDHWQHIIDTDGSERPSPDIAVVMAERMLPDARDQLRKAQAVLASMQTGSALQFKGVVYAQMAGRA